MRIRGISAGAITIVVLLTLAALGTRPAQADDAEMLQRAADAALQPVGADLGGRRFENIKSIAVIPLRGDSDGYVTEHVRDLITQTPYALFTREDQVWNELLREIEWGVRREDVMNPETVQKFGKIEGVDAILYGTIWDNSINLWSIRGHTKVSLVLADVETGQELWRSGPLAGEAFIHWSDALMQFWRFPLLVLVAFVVLGIILLGLRKLRKAYKPI
jgi:hypothetical protein